MNATGEALGRGMWLGKGRIHIYAPAAMENTSFHEAFHDLVLEAIGEDAVQQMSVSLYKGLSGELRKKYNNSLLVKGCYTSSGARDGGRPHDC